MIGKSHPDFVSDPYIADFQFLPGVRYIFGLFHQFTHCFTTLCSSFLDVSAINGHVIYINYCFN